MIAVRQSRIQLHINTRAERSGRVMVMEVPTEVPFILKTMVAVISAITFLLMAFLTVKIYRDEARPERKGQKNKGW